MEESVLSISECEIKESGTDVFLRPHCEHLERPRSIRFDLTRHARVSSAVPIRLESCVAAGRGRSRGGGGTAFARVHVRFEFTRKR